MDNVVAFFKELIEREYAALVALHTSPDDGEFQAASSRVQDLFAGDLEPDLHRPSPLPESWLVTGRKMFKDGSIAPRTLFQVKEYRHPQHGRLYRGYVSAPGPEGGMVSYFSSYFALWIQGALKIISRYDLDLIQDQPGPHLNDSGLTWIYAGGAELDAPGELVRSIKILPPDDPEQRAEYERELA